MLYFILKTKKLSETKICWGENLWQKITCIHVLSDDEFFDAWKSIIQQHLQWNNKIHKTEEITDTKEKLFAVSIP